MSNAHSTTHEVTACPAHKFGHLLTVGNPKTAKGSGYGYHTAIMHFAPSDISGYNVCPDASPQCILLCLNTAGRGGIIKHGETTNNVQRARLARTLYFFEQRAEFLPRLRHEITAHVRAAARHGLAPAVRLNGTSDIPFEVMYPSLFAEFAHVTLYDYTKSERRMMRFLRGECPANYSLTFSRSEINGAASARVLAAGGNVAVVFSTKRGHALPATFDGVRVIDGDVTDLRFLDARGVVIGLRAKGRARKTEFQGGFVVCVDALPALQAAA